MYHEQNFDGKRKQRLTYAKDFPLKTTGGATAAKIQKPM